MFERWGGNGFGCNSEILFFILIFLLLFWDGRGCFGNENECCD